MFKKKDTDQQCRWAGHGQYHQGPAVFDITLGRPCGHQTEGPIATCWQQAQLMLADRGRSPVQTPCPVCSQPSAIRVIDPDHHTTDTSRPTPGDTP